MSNTTQRPSDIREKIIRTTIALIERSDGLVENITVREIAQKAGVAVGLINYHFTSKKNLIEICVQRMISQVMKTFSGAEPAAGKPADAVHAPVDMPSFTASIFTFLIRHPEISKISMLGDLAQPDTESNSAISYRAILKAIADAEPEEPDQIKAFMFLATIQSAFLNRQISRALFGFDLNEKEHYERFFRRVTEILNIT